MPSGAARISSEGTLPIGHGGDSEYESGLDTQRFIVTLPFSPDQPPRTCRNRGASFRRGKSGRGGGGGIGKGLGEKNASRNVMTFWEDGDAGREEVLGVTLRTRIVRRAETK